MIRILYLLAGLGLILGLVAGYFGFVHPGFDTVAHFRWHAALGLLALAIAGLAMRIRRAPLILVAFAAIGIWTSDVNNRIGGQQSGAADGSPVHALLTYNLRFDNPERDAVVAMLLEQDADILALSETSQQWEDALVRLQERYPQRHHCPEWSVIGGVMIFSKFPIEGSADYCHPYAAIGITRIALPGGIIEVGSVHLRWPWPASGPSQVRAMQPRLRQLGADALVAGDFNATPWSDTVRRFARDGGLTVARGVGGTWIYKRLPTALAPVLGLPIDHVMSKGRVRILEARTLTAIGSDHLPILARFTLAPPGASSD